MQLLQSLRRSCVQSWCIRMQVHDGGAACGRRDGAQWHGLGSHLAGGLGNHVEPSGEKARRRERHGGTVAAVRGADKTRCSHLPQLSQIVYAKNSRAGQLGFSLSDASPVLMRTSPLPSKHLCAHILV